jgi:spermidine/putrescine transport system permease protein
MSEGAVAAIPETEVFEGDPVPRAQSSRSGRVGRRPWGTYLLWVVTILGFAYLFIPLITIIVFTFNNPGGSKFNTSWNAFTWDNWTNAFQSSEYTDALIVSLKVALVSCVIATIFGTLIALALGRYRVHGGALWNMLLVLPLTTPEIVFGASLFTLFFNQGVSRGFWTIVIAHCAFTVSFVALTVKARIRGLDWSLEDAAADLGSPPLRTFMTITFPVIIPGIIAAFLLSLSLSIDDYIITSFVAGDVSTLPRKIFDSAKVQILPQVHVLATMIMLVAILILVLGTVAGNRRRAKAR